jgi:hypothetical protein
VKSRRATVGLALLVLASRVGAQELDLHVARGPHYAGVPIEIELRALGFEEDPQPEARAPSPARGGLELLDVAPNVSSSITIVDGRISQTKTVEFVYRFRLLVSQPGPLEVGPFQVSQGSVVRTAPALSLEVRGVPESSSSGLRRSSEAGCMPTGCTRPSSISRTSCASSTLPKWQAARRCPSRRPPAP